MFKSLFKSHAERAFAEAIANHDLPAMRRRLESGVRQIDYLLMRDGDRPGERVPACKFNDPLKLAQYVGMPRPGIELLAQYGLADPAAVQAAKPPGAR